MLLSGGTVTSSLGIRVGDFGSGTFIQTGGAVKIATLVLGQSASTGRYSISGGTLSTSTLTIAAAGSVAHIIPTTGGFVDVFSTIQAPVIINEDSGSTGNLNISGGTFQMHQSDELENPAAEQPRHGHADRWRVSLPG